MAGGLVQRLVARGRAQVMAARLRRLQYAKTRAGIEPRFQLVPGPPLHAILHPCRQGPQHSGARQAEEGHDRPLRTIRQKGEPVEQRVCVQHEGHQIHAKARPGQRGGLRQQHADLVKRVAIQANHAERARLAHGGRQFRLRHAAHAGLQNGQARAKKRFHLGTAGNLRHGVPPPYSAARFKSVTNPCLVK